MKKTTFIFLISWGLTGTLFLKSRAIHFKRISVDEGLSQSAIFCILQDSKGFLWIGTQDGLNKYTGYTFHVFKSYPDDTNSLSHNWITAIYEDDSGMIWIGTNGGGLNRFDPKKEKFFRYPVDEDDPNCINSGFIRTICQDTTGAIWIGTGGGGLSKLTLETHLENPGTKKERITHYRHIPGNPNSLRSDSVNAVIEDVSGLLWIGTSSGLDMFDKKMENFTHYINIPNDPFSLSHNGVHKIYEDRSGLLWVGTSGGLNLLNQETGRFTRYRRKSGDSTTLSSDRVTAILEDRSGVLWIGTRGGGLNKFDKRTETFTHFRNIPDDPYSLSFDNITCIYEDRSRILWIGTSGKGLNRFDRENHFELYQSNPNNSNSLSDNYIYSVYEDRFGILWIGTAGGGLNQFDRKTGTFTHYRSNAIDPGSLSSNTIRAIFEDSSGVLWIGTGGGGLNQFDRKTGTFIHFCSNANDPGSLSYNTVFSIFEDSSGVLWIGTSGGGLNKFNRKTGTFTYFRRLENNSNSLGGDFVNAIYETQTEPGVLWIGTRHCGLTRFDTRKDTFTHYEANPNDPHSLNVNFVLSIYEDSSGVLWVGTYGGGLNKLIGRRGEDERIKFVHYTEKNGLSNNSIYGILEDSAGNLWMSTNKGISTFDPESETFKNYSVKDGLQGNEFNGGAYHKSKSGEMFFGGVKGLNAFYPTDVKVNPHIPPVVITGFRISNNPVEIGVDSPLKQSIIWTEEMKLSYRQNALSFEFTALDFTIPENNKYAYMMEGFDRDWNYTDSEKRFAYYTNLDPREYVFRVKGTNNDGIWNEEGDVIKIVIKPPWWQTWWFRMVGIMAILFLILTIHKIRIYRIRKRSKQLEEVNAALNVQIKERKMLEEKLVRQEKLALLGQLAGGVGHELRNPLGAIKNSTYFLNMVLEESEPEVKQTLKILEKEVATSEKIISSLLDFARVRPPHKRKVNINDIIQEVLSYTNVPEDIEVKRQIVESIPSIMADPDQLGQVFGNIILNAIQAMPGGGQLIIKCKSPRSDRVAVSITDTGVGIPEENLEKIFEPLFTSRAKGIGLGLAITKIFMEGHGGTIEVQSKAGKGSTFTIKLPIGNNEEK